MKSSYIKQQSEKQSASKDGLFTKKIKELSNNKWFRWVVIVFACLMAVLIIWLYIASTSRETALAEQPDVSTKPVKEISDNTNESIEQDKEEPEPIIKRTNVETLYGYLHVFPHELGEFQKEPTDVIANINQQNMYDYNDWRLPTEEELSLLKENNYLGKGQYMHKYGSAGRLLLVTTGKSVTEVKAQEQATNEEKAKERAKERLHAIQKLGYVDLGLPSGTLWKKRNEVKRYTYYEAEKIYGERIPTKEQVEELINYCTWHSSDSGYNVVGPNGNQIRLGYIEYGGRYYESTYWTRTETYAYSGEAFSFDNTSNTAALEISDKINRYAVCQIYTTNK